MDKEIAYTELRDSTVKHWARVCGLWPQLRYPKPPEIVMNTRTFRVAGTAMYDEHIIEYSLKLYPYHKVFFHKIIVPHECLHLACQMIYKPRQHHGPEWKNMMVQYGIPPDMYHSLKYPPKDNN